MLATVFVVFFERTAPGSGELLKKNLTGSNMLWVANGILLAYLLMAPRWRWPGYLVAAVLALVTGNVIIHESWRMNLLYNVLDIAEVLIAAQLMRGRTAQLPRFTDHSYLIRFFAFAVLAAPLAVSIIYALIMAWWTSLPLLKGFLSWACSESLGILVITPLCVAIFQSNFFDLRYWRKNGFLVALTAICAICAFSFGSIPVIFAVYPLLVVVTLRAGLGWGALTLLLVAIACSWYTIRGQGLFVAASSITTVGSCVLLQMYVAIGMFMLYSVSLVMERQKATERQLQKIAYLHNLVSENSRDVIILADFNGSRSFVSSAAAENMSGWTPEELAIQTSLELVHPDDRPKAEAAVRTLLAGSEGAMIELRIRKKSGEYFWVESSLRTIRDPVTGLPSGLLDIVRDITERKRAEQAREFHSSLIRAIHNVSLSGVLVVNDEGTVVSMNQRLSEIWRIPLPTFPRNFPIESPPEEFALIKDWRLMAQVADLVKDRQAYVEKVEELYTHPDASDQSEIELKDGRTLSRYSTSLRGESGQCLGRVWFFNDITERKQAEEKLQDAYRAVETLAMTDALTGLANRRRFDQCLSSEWRRALRERQALSLLMIDADLFKLYNDAFGHLCGDSCLKQIAEAAQDVVERPGDLVARFGGEEFAVILPNTPNVGALQVANEICAALRARQLPHPSNPNGIVTISVGCATMVPPADKHSAHLVEQADQALYKAKQQGRNQVCNLDASPTAGGSAWGW
jgi:diguanylate cyclase (GGDEF)-like protein/PAS domain S-box-containing protein